MTQYIDKNALVAEIESRITQFRSEKSKEDASVSDKLSLGGRIAALEEFKVFINTFEVKEVDDEPACKIFPRPIECYSDCKECPWLATNNKTQKGK